MSRSASHCRTARAVSTTTPGVIQALIAYSTAKCTGAHMRKRRRTATRSEGIGSGDRRSPGITAVTLSTVRAP